MTTKLAMSGSKRADIAMLREFEPLQLSLSQVLQSTIFLTASCPMLPSFLHLSFSSWVKQSLQTVLVSPDSKLVNEIIIVISFFGTIILKNLK